jgi:hypothetical protein
MTVVDNIYDEDGNTLQISINQKNRDIIISMGDDGISQWVLNSSYSVIEKYDEDCEQSKEYAEILADLCISFMLEIYKKD